MEELGALCCYGPYQETTVGSPTNRKSLFTRVALVDEKFGCGDKVVEYILLLQFGAGNVPRFSVLTATADVGHSVHAAHFKPSSDRATEARADADIEAAIGVQNGWCRSIENRVLPIGDDHGNTRAIL